MRVTKEQTDIEQNLCRGMPKSQTEPLDEVDAKQAKKIVFAYEYRPCTQIKHIRYHSEHVGYMHGECMIQSQQMLRKWPWSTIQYRYSKYFPAASTKIAPVMTKHYEQFMWPFK